MTRRQSDTRSAGEKAFDGFNLVFLLCIGLIALYPFWYTVSLSVSTAAEARREGLHLFPGAVSFQAYQIILANPDIRTGFLNTVVRTILGTIVTLVLTCLAAYPLARKDLPHRGLITFLVLFTMVFSGGIVPGYLLVRSLGLINTVWALVLPSALSAYNVLVLRNFFERIPESLHEAARMEQAREWQILWGIYLPLSRPILATICLWSCVVHWNQWFDAMLYITDIRKQVLQYHLQRIVVENSTQMIDIGKTAQEATNYTPDTLKAATVVLTILPILILLPFVQRHLSSGFLLGGVKE